MTREEAIKCIRGFMRDLTDGCQEALEFAIPELAESEDERIRKRLIEYFGGFMLGKVNVKWEGLCVEGILAWLEKQKEQKPAEWSEIEVEFRGEKVKVKRPFFRDDKGHGYSTTEQDDWVTWDALRAWCEKHGYTPFDLYPQQQWSEEDSKRYISIGTTLETSVVLSKEDYDANMAWLRELVNAKKYSVPKPHWKPSEEHLSALLAVFNDPDNIGSQTCQLALTDLYEQLKKL